MAYSYKGTKITGTSTASKIFKKSGVKNAKKGQTYFNTQTGHVYTCTVKGEAKEAKWKYTRTDIAKKPSVAVSSLSAPTRQSGNRQMKATWKTPAAMVDTKKGNRATDLNIEWFLGIAGKDPNKLIKTSNEKLTSSTINLDNLPIGRKTYKRNEFYPFANKPKLTYVTVKVTSKNSKGAGASAKATRNFTVPRDPSISAFTFNAETGTLSCTISTDAGTDYRERYDTRYKMTVYYSSTKKTSVIHDTSTTATSKTISFDDANYAARAYGDYAKVTVQAWARGYAGNSKTITKTHYISYPSAATIKDVNVSSKASDGKCTIYVATNSTTEHPVDRVRLEYLANSEYATAQQISGDASWESTEIMDDAQCNAMAMPVADLIPDRGKYTWVRLKTYHDNEDVLYRYSNYWRVTQLETPAATTADDKIKIVSIKAGADGESAIVDLVWEDGTPPSTGTELTWSKDEDCWKSTEEPSMYMFVWSDGPKIIDGEEWSGSARITIKNLEEGLTYFVKARRYLEGDTTTYSEYSNTSTIVTSEKPESVVATVDRYIPNGSSLNVYWTFAGNGLQKTWQIVKEDKTVIASGEGSISSTQISAERLISFAENGSLKFTVQVSTGSDYVISEEHIVTIIDKPTLNINVPAIMNAQPFSFIATVSNPSDLIVIITSQGANSQFPQGLFRQTAGDTIHSNVYTPEWEKEYVATSDTQVIDKRYYEYDGTNYTPAVIEGESGVVDPSINPMAEGWYEEVEGVTATITIPPALQFWDLGSYSVSVVAIDRQTQLRSDEKISSFSVAWSHQAPSLEPINTYVLTSDTEIVEDKTYFTYDSTTQIYNVIIPEGTENPTSEGWYELESVINSVVLTPQDYTDENGFHHQAVQIELVPPQGSTETDVYDIYRLTGDGAELIGESFPLTYTAIDEYAPFGDDITHYYRIAIRTVDGDVAFSDFEYTLDGDTIRIDWAEGFLEFPYNISIADSYKKNVDIRQHLDGSVGGYWNQGIERKGSLSTNAIKLIQNSDINLTRQLARYTGPAFVRTREGTAFEADVQITNLSNKNLAVMDIAIDATEIDLTSEFMLPIPFKLQENDNGLD